VGESMTQERVAVQTQDCSRQIIDICRLEEFHSAVAEVVFDCAQPCSYYWYSNCCIIKEFHRQHQMRGTARPLWDHSHIGDGQQRGQFLDRNQFHEADLVNEFQPIDKSACFGQVVALANHLESQSRNCFTQRSDRRDEQIKTETSGHRSVTYKSEFSRPRIATFALGKDSSIGSIHHHMDFTLRNPGLL